MGIIMRHDKANNERNNYVITVKKSDAKRLLVRLESQKNTVLVSYGAPNSEDNSVAQIQLTSHWSSPQLAQWLAKIKGIEVGKFYEDSP